MHAFKNILVAYDGSEHSRTALDTTMKIAQCSKCQTKVRCDFDRAPLVLSDDETALFIEHAVNQGCEMLAKATLQLCDKDLNFSADTAEGRAAEAILRVAQLDNCDLSVMGSRGLGMVQDLRLSSVSYRVLHHATSPVLIVH